MNTLTFYLIYVHVAVKKKSKQENMTAKPKRRKPSAAAGSAVGNEPGGVAGEK